MQLYMDKAQQLKIKTGWEWLKKADSVVVCLAPPLAAEAGIKGCCAGPAPRCQLFPGSLTSLMPADQPGDVWLFLKLESVTGGGKLGCYFLIWNLRHGDVAAMRDTQFCFHGWGPSRGRAWGPKPGLPQAAGNSPGCGLAATPTMRTVPCQACAALLGEFSCWLSLTFFTFLRRVSAGSTG